MIRRLATAIRRLARRQPTPPSEPHSRYGIDCDVDAAYDQPGWPGQRTPRWFQADDPCHCHGTGCPADCETCHEDVLDDDDDDGAVPTEVLLSPVRDTDEHHASAADLHRPDIAPRGWRVWRRTQLDAGTREWLDAMKAPTVTFDEHTRDLIARKEDRDWDARLFHLRWVLAERTEEMALVLVSVEGKLLAGAR